MKIEQIPEVSLIKLVGAYLKGLKRFAGLEKKYIKNEVVTGLGRASAGAGITIAGLVLLALGGLLLLVTAVLVLNIWLQQWLSALIVASVLLLTGIVVVLIGLYKVKKNMARTKASFGQAGKDIKCLKSK